MAATDASFAQYSLPQIISGCRDESRQKREKESGYCYELFRRALVLKDNQAWQAVQEQYNKLIIQWLHQKSVGEAASLEDLRQETWSRFWRTLSNKAETLTTKFSHVGALLSYLNRCAWATCVDEQRQQRKQQLIEEKLRVAAHTLPDQQRVGEWLEKREDLARIKEWVDKEVTDAEEKLVLFLSYERGLTPKQIAQQYPDKFIDVKQVHRIKERVLKRARYQLT